MDYKSLYKKILYIIIICFFGLFIGLYLFNSSTIREGARTLPRPVINEYIADIKPFDDPPLPPYYGESLNGMIDRNILMYFDKTGYPYTDTIQLYMDYVTVGGVLTNVNKSKLNDIGYYLINIAIPNIQTGNNPAPVQSWPPIRWTGEPTFNVQNRPTSTYKIYNGQSWGLDLSDYGSNIGSNTGSNTGSKTGSKCDKNANECRISCPTNCLDGVAAAWEETEKLKAEVANKENNDNMDGLTFGSWFTDGWNTRTNIPGVGSLTGGTNQLIIGSQEVDGYQITDVDIPIISPSTLNTKIEDFINYYFIASGSNKGKPTQEAINLFNEYFKDKIPMDRIHMNKLRDVVYYMMQSIIPGLPTDEKPRAYVEWRPIKWLSRSEK